MAGSRMLSYRATRQKNPPSGDKDTSFGAHSADFEDYFYSQR